jgi:hypothetical protein
MSYTLRFYSLCKLGPPCGASAYCYPAVGLAPRDGQMRPHILLCSCAWMQFARTLFSALPAEPIDRWEMMWTEASVEHVSITSLPRIWHIRVHHYYHASLALPRSGVGRGSARGLIRCSPAGFTYPVFGACLVVVGSWDNRSFSRQDYTQLVQFAVPAIPEFAPSLRAEAAVSQLWDGAARSTSGPILEPEPASVDDAASQVLEQYELLFDPLSKDR